MDILKQFTIILCIGMLATLIRTLTGLALPANVIGIIILLVLLMTKVIKVKHIDSVSEFLLANLALLFIPLGVSLMNYLDVLGTNIWKFLLVCFLSTIITFYVTTQTVILLRKVIK